MEADCRVFVSLAGNERTGVSWREPGAFKSHAKGIKCRVGEDVVWRGDNLDSYTTRSLSSVRRLVGDVGAHPSYPFRNLPPDIHCLAERRSVRGADYGEATAIAFAQ